MERLLQTIGKAKFVTYFYQFRNFTEADMITFLVLNNVCNEAGAIMRTKSAREIFENDDAENALRNIIESKVPDLVIQNAQLLLNNL